MRKETIICSFLPNFNIKQKAQTLRVYASVARKFPTNHGSCSSTSTSSTSNSNSGASSSAFASLFASSATSATASFQPQTPVFTDLIRAMGHPDHPADLSRPSSSG
ncbi:Zinc finger protein MAGPIE [Spatholobus suberectus]|nr:Zinc finger protein MAGPIE [Spatholobus suberectus]